MPPQGLDETTIATGSGVFVAVAGDITVLQFIRAVVASQLARIGSMVAFLGFAGSCITVADKRFATTLGGILDLPCCC